MISYLRPLSNILEADYISMPIDYFIVRNEMLQFLKWEKKKKKKKKLFLHLVIIISLYL